MPKKPPTLGPDWDIPQGLCRAGNKAAEALRQFCLKHDLTHTGGRVFYTPAEWRARGESHGLHSLLIITYDGGACRSVLSLDGYDYPKLEAFAKILDGFDVYAEEMTHWYAAIHNA